MYAIHYRTSHVPLKNSAVGLPWSKNNQFDAQNNCGGNGDCTHSVDTVITSVLAYDINGCVTYGTLVRSHSSTDTQAQNQNI